jgi:hypothetical protein
VLVRERGAAMSFMLLLLAVGGVFFWIVSWATSTQTKRPRKLSTKAHLAELQARIETLESLAIRNDGIDSSRAYRLGLGERAQEAKALTAPAPVPPKWWWSLERTDAQWARIEEDPRLQTFSEMQGHCPQCTWGWKPDAEGRRELFEAAKNPIGAPTHLRRSTGPLLASRRYAAQRCTRCDAYWRVRLSNAEVDNVRALRAVND